MSYILDALRRAEAERERGSVPGLHSRPVPAAAPAAVRRYGAGFWVAAGTAALLLAALVWTLTGRDRTPSAATPMSQSTPAPAALGATSTPNRWPSSAPVAVPAARPVAPPVARRTPAPASAAVAAAAGPAAARPASAPASAVPPAPRVVPYEQLPDDVRRQLPQLAIAGAIYSEVNVGRMLIVGGQLLHEGDSVAPGVTLEQIKPSSAVLRWRDLHYEVGF